MIRQNERLPFTHKAKNPAGFVAQLALRQSLHGHFAQTHATSVACVLHIEAKFNHIMDRTIVMSAQTCARLTDQVESRQVLDHRDRKVFEEGSPHVGCGEQRIVSTG